MVNLGMMAVLLGLARWVGIVSVVSGTGDKTLDGVIPENSCLCEGQYQEITSLCS